MKLINVTKLIAGLSLFAVGIATGLAAQSLSDSVHRVERKRVDLTGSENMEVVASVVEIGPGESSELHIHHGVEVFYVLQGATTQGPGETPREIPTGFAAMNLRDAKHGAFKVLGDKSLKLFTVHIVDKGKPLYDSPN